MTYEAFLTKPFLPKSHRKRRPGLFRGLLPFRAWSFPVRSITQRSIVSCALVLKSAPAKAVRANSVFGGIIFEVSKTTPILRRKVRFYVM